MAPASRPIRPIQCGVSSGASNALKNMRSRTAMPAAFGPADRKLVTGVGAPS